MLDFSLFYSQNKSLGKNLNISFNISDLNIFPITFKYFNIHYITQVILRSILIPHIRAIMRIIPFQAMILIFMLIRSAQIFNQAISGLGQKKKLPHKVRALRDTFKMTFYAFSPLLSTLAMSVYICM